MDRNKCNSDYLKIIKRTPILIPDCQVNPDMQKYKADNHARKHVCYMFSQLRHARRVAVHGQSNNDRANKYSEYSFCARMWPKHAFGCDHESESQTLLSL